MILHEEFEDLIYNISPAETPLLSRFRYGRFAFGRPGGSMRKQRRRKGKPLRFTAWRGVGYGFKAGYVLHQWNVPEVQTTAG